MAKQTVNQSFTGDDIDALSKKTAQLSALLYMTYGEGGDAFRRVSDAFQDDYMWACADLASEVRVLSQKLAAA